MVDAPLIHPLHSLARINTPKALGGMLTFTTGPHRRKTKPLLLDAMLSHVPHVLFILHAIALCDSTPHIDLDSNAIGCDVHDLHSLLSPTLDIHYPFLVDPPMHDMWS